MNYKIIPLQKSHIDLVVDIHIKAFPGFFLSFLGPRFLKEFYQSFAEDPIGIGFVAVDSDCNQVIAVTVGPLVPAGYFKRLLKRKWWAFCLASISAVIKKPSVIKRLFRAVFYRGDSPAHADALALLSSIAVSPDVQAKGIGAALVNAFVQEVKKRGGKGIFLTTDAQGNDKVNRFYQKMGFTLESSYTTPEGRQMNRYILIFSNHN
ncbi:MAG TPA: GNAT family N-acetyltransferase [Anaerohalosphaeraceae bacterium]|nr:GNAT family N-acetyltransferase [Anaerohalosphaeraceae bacterium]HOL32774.1 GNAT family N-acetyltransferase [Anaerohalosphaeraceae bacterium]HOM76695.1 GNAT family N-acetyltransferase [Anaerohalosphaeraceae bacterium]HPC64120.1 GNAT family N-acetyltransferase [Anaerohalosphaeraceae bacterium]HPO70288.1 GNAT family N-acetyltransferase [Anaerohalosphaeraceae bacterium]